jgi:hypothetical protein
VFKECLECFYARGPRGIKPWVVTTQLNPSTGVYELVIPKRGKAVSLEVSKRLIEHHQVMAKLGPDDLSMLIDWESVQRF